METIGDRIKEKRKELGLTQLELAEKLNVTDRAVSKWEQGEGDPSIAILPELAKIFDVTLDYLMTGKQVDIISLDDMDSNKRLEYLIKKDDVNSYKKYGYSTKLQKKISFDYEFPFKKHNRDEHHLFDINQISQIIDSKANKIFNLVCDEICNDYKMISLSCMFEPILDDIIMMAIDNDRADLLQVLGFKFLTLSEKNTSRVRRQYESYVVPFLITNINNGFLSEYGRLLETHSIKPATFDYLFENKNKASKCYKYIMNLEIKYSVNEHNTYFVYDGDLPYRLLDKAIELDDENYIEKFFNIAKEQFEATNFSTKDDYHIGYKSKYDQKNGYLYNDHSIRPRSILSRLFYMPKNLIYKLIDNKQEKLAREMMEYNTKLSISLNQKLRLDSEKNKLKFFTMNEAELNRYKELNNNILSDKEREMVESVNNHIIVSGYLKGKDDLKFVKKVLDENYYHPYEFAYKSLHNKKEKELYRYFIDTENEKLADLLMQGKDYYNELLFNVLTTYKHAPNALFLKENSKKLTEYMKETITKEDEKIARQDYNSESFLKLEGTIEDYIDYNCNFMDKNNPIIRHIEDLKNDIYESVKSKIEAKKKEEDLKNERAKVVKGLTKEYFQELLKKSENELFIIKLSSLLDAILKFDYRYEQEDFAGRLKAYCDFCESLLPKSRHMDDGLGYMVLDTKYEEEVVKPERANFEKRTNLLNRLRMLRNNIAHSETKQVKEFTPQEMEECMELVCSMNKKEEM